MRNIRFVVAYDGGRYSGWQRQPNVATIQQTLESRLAQITQQPCRVHGAGRTDAGVHADGQLASFRTESKLSVERIHRGLNALLPDDIAILRTDEVSADFDPRRHNRGKHYRYQIFNRRERDVRHDRFCWRVHGELNTRKMAWAAQRLVGSHDFAAFRAADCDRQTTRRTIYRCTLAITPPLMQLDVEGTAFLKNMVRIIAGTLVDIGRGRLAASAIEELLETGDRTAAGMTAPAQGLTLVRVFL